MSSKPHLELSSLCYQFQALFQQLRENKKKKFEISKLNSKFIQEIEEEKSNRNISAQRIAEEKNLLEYQLKLQEEQVKGNETSGLQLDSAIQLFEKQEMMVNEESKEVESQLTEREKSISMKIQKQNIIEQEISQLSNMSHGEKDLLNTLNKVQQSLDTEKEKLADIIQKISEVQQSSHDSILSKEKIEAEISQINLDIQNSKQTNIIVNDQIKNSITTMNLETEELNSRINMLQTQYRYNEQLNRQVKNLDSLSQILNQMHQNPKGSEGSKQIEEYYKNELLSQLGHQKKEIEFMDSHINSLYNEANLLSQSLDWKLQILSTDELKEMYMKHFNERQENDFKEQEQQQQSNQSQQ